MSRGPQPQRAAKALPVVFVVDDDPSVREALSSLFRSVDLQVELFGSTAEFLQHKRPDGASCLVLTTPKLAKRMTDSYVHVIGTGQAQDTFCLHERESLTTVKAAKSAAQEAYRMANTKPKDVEVAEVHDCFTIAEIIAYEDLGFCRAGQGGKLVESGATSLGGSLPVNTSGGLKSKGHPVGATGTAQIAELYLQLTGQADRRQVKDADIALAHNLGGSGATAIVHILRGS